MDCDQLTKKGSQKLFYFKLPRFSNSFDTCGDIFHAFQEHLPLEFFTLEMIIKAKCMLQVPTIRILPELELKDL